MPSVTLQAPASWTLDQLNGQIAKAEARHGALTGIGNDGQFTLMVCDDTGIVPKANAVVAAQNAGNPVIPSGSDLVCSGTIFVAGMLTLCAATRAK